jgi:hypothetical protein
MKVIEYFQMTTCESPVMSVEDYLQGSAFFQGFRLHLVEWIESDSDDSSSVG